MYLILIITVFHLVSSSQEGVRIYGERNDIKSNQISLNRISPISPYNSTYIEKSENMLRVPVIRKYFVEQKGKRKVKKSPKRTVQKIIKKNKNRSKKVFLDQVTNQPSPQPRKEHENPYAQESLLKEVSPTTQTNQKKKSRRWNPKLARYPMPFQKLQRRDNKFKRSVDRDLYILKDLDELKFLSSDKDYDVVNAHVENYW